jgi:hypothetical protein
MKKTAKHPATKKSVSKRSRAFAGLLRYFMPQVETHAERQKRYFDFLLDHSWTYEQASQHIDEMKRRDNFTANHRSNIASVFVPWWKAKLSAQRRQIGIKGGRPRKSAN